MFLHFVARRIPPIRHDAHDQNAAAIRAIAAAAGAFASSGYDVVVDGVIGPVCPTFMQPLDSLSVEIDYIVLRAPLEQTLQRALARPKTDADDEAVVRHLHPEFADLGQFEAHVEETGGQTTDETLAVLSQLRPTGRFTLASRR